MNKQVRGMMMLAAFGASALAVAAPQGRLTLLPGLYQVEVKSEQGKMDGVAPPAMCVKPMQSISISHDMLAGGCTLTKGQVVDARVVMQLSCPWNRTNTSTRQVDARTWETTVDSITQRGPDRADVAASMAQMRYMAEQVAKRGDPAERAEAKAFLANAKQIEAGLKAVAPTPMAPGMAALMAKNEGARVRLVQRMTRVGECKG